MTIELTATTLVAPDVLVDGLVTDCQTILSTQATADLLGADVSAQQLLDQHPVGRGEPMVAARAASACIALLLCAYGAIAAVVSTTVPSNLTADGAGVSAEHTSELRVRDPRLLFPQRC